MISLKVLSTAAALALVLPMVAPTASFAQNPNGTKFNYAGRGVGAVAPAARFGGGGGGAPVAQFRGGGGGGGWQGGYHHHGGGGFIPGAVAGAVIGGAIASQSYGYGYGYGPGYYGPGYAPGYYGDQYYDDSAVVAVAPAPDGGDDVAYCMQTYRSYDPRSGTYLGNDGYRHPCP